MTVLNPLAVQNAPLLRELAKDGPAEPVTVIAKRIGRDESNVRKTIKALIAEGLAADPMTLTPEGEDQLAAIDRAENGTDKPGLSAAAEGSTGLVHAQILPDVQNARRDWDSAEAEAELEALKEDIIAHGLLQNLVVRGPEAASDDFAIAGPDGVALPLYTLVGGERRWRAIGKAIADGGWPADRRIACRVLDTDDLGHRLAALSENLQRRNLNPLEKAKAFDGLARAFADNGVADDKINREIADRVGVTIEHVQQTRSFMKLSESDQTRLALPKDDPKRLKIAEARQLISAKVQAEAEASAFLEIPALERLAMTEIFHAIAERGTYSYADIVVDRTAAESEVGKALVARGWVRFSVRNYGDETMFGNDVVTRNGAPPRLGMPFWSGTATDHEAALRKAQAEAGYPGRTDYVTGWLNAPFARSAEGQAMVDQRAADEAEREVEDAAEAQERLKKEQARLDEIARQAAVAAHCRQIFANRRQSAPSAEEVTEVATAADAPLPWRMNHKGDVVAADGTTLIGGRRDDRAEARMRLLILSVNAAAGIETPDDEPDPNPILDEDAFTASMIEALERHGSDLSASPILTAFLTDNGVEYGAAGWNWTAQGADHLVVEAINNAAADADDDAAEEAEGEEAERAYSAADHEDA